MAILSLNVWALSSFLATLTNIAFWAFVLFKNPRSVLNRAWSLAIFCLILWGCGQFVLRMTADAATAGIAQKISGIGFCLIPSPFLHFALAFADRKRLLQKRWIYPVIYAPGVIFAVLATRGYIIKLVHLPWGFASDPHVGYWPYIIWLETYFSWGLYLCYRKWRAARSHRERNQTMFIIVGVTVPLLIGSVTDAFLPLLGMETFRSAVLATTVTAALVTYAIVKLQLMSLTPQTTAGAILNTIGDVLAVTDREGYVIFTNESFRKILSNHSSHHGESGRLHIKDFIEEANEVLTEATLVDGSTGKSHVLEVHYKTRQGASFPALLSISSIFDRGESIGFVLVARDITERKKLEELAQQRNADLQHFATSVQRAQEEERRRIARELHDDLGQRLTGMKLNIEMYEDDIPKTNKRVRRRLAQMKRQIDMMITEIRRISSNLRPTALDDFGLVVALQLLCSDFQKAQHLKVKFHADKLEHSDEQVEIAVYRIVQEALSNIARHAGATTVSVHLIDRGAAMALMVEDDGKGFGAEDLPGQKGSRRGLGLLSMKERAKLLGGRFQIDSSPKRGTRIHVVIPLSSHGHEENQDTDR